jgi:hypothetical protein
MHTNCVKEEGRGGREEIGLCEQDSDSRKGGSSGRDVN